MAMGSVRFDAATALSAAADLDALADRLEATLKAETPALRVQSAGADEVSLQAADTLTGVGNSYVQQSGLGIGELRALAAAVRTHAATFQQIESDSTADFTNL
ncbi:PE family protein [Nocardia jejuensis]|uniref:PE family protein n=1 Tax=Nocardia jejuensis TaxID=328049 RepID=UPI000833D7D6|nr:PE family protein [Nocardia jejuensis]